MFSLGSPLTLEKYISWTLRNINQYDIEINLHNIIKIFIFHIYLRFKHLFRKQFVQIRQ